MKTVLALLLSISLLPISTVAKARPDKLTPLIGGIGAFAKKYNLTYEIVQVEKTGLYGARFWSNPPASFTVWNEDGYPEPELAVAAVELDYLKYPNGHDGVYKKG